MRALVALSLLVILFAAGCLGGAKDAATDPALAATNKSLATNVTVDDGSAKVTNATTGAQPHKHDYWKGKERVTILQEDLQLAPGNQSDFIPFFLDQKPAYGASVVTLPDGMTVFEGTGRVEFTALWSDPTVTGLTLRYKSTGNPDYTKAVALATGTALSIEVTPQMTDEPHAKSSRWGFILEADGPSGAGIADGKVSIKIDIIKMRDIETFPAHPDLFAGAESIVLMDKDVTIKSDGSVDNVQAFFSHAATPPGFAPTKPVPPEAKSILVRLDVKSISATNPAEDTTKIDMSYRTAASSFRYQDAKLEKQADKTYVFSAKVDAQDGDGYYAKESAWRLDPVLTDNTQGQEVRCPFGDCFTWTMNVHVTMIAYKGEADPAQILGKA